MDDADDIDDVWDKMTSAQGGRQDDDPAGQGADDTDDADDAGAPQIDLGPPIRVTLVIRAEQVPVAPWAQGWRIGALGPIDGLVTMVFEHDVDVAPVQQLAAITGLLSTVKAARLELEWWAMQLRGPIAGGEEPDLDREFAQLLEDDAERPSPPGD